MGLSLVILTNFMMLEKLTIRQNDIDKAVMHNAKGLRFLVLDELHIHPHGMLLTRPWQP